jgi:hypothetical protein
MVEFCEWALYFVTTELDPVVHAEVERMQPREV